MSPSLFDPAPVAERTPADPPFPADPGERLAIAVRKLPGFESAGVEVYNSLQSDTLLCVNVALPTYKRGFSVARREVMDCLGWDLMDILVRRKLGGWGGKL